MVELLFLPSVYAPCPTCHGARYNDENAGDQLSRQEHRRRARHDRRCGLRVLRRRAAAVQRALDVLREVGLGYLRLGQPATELSGGEAQRIKLATELQRHSAATTLYVLDEPTTGLHPADVEKLMSRSSTDWSMRATPSSSSSTTCRSSASDWVIDMGPGAGTKEAGSWRRARQPRSPNLGTARLRPTLPGFCPGVTG